MASEPSFPQGSFLELHYEPEPFKWEIKQPIGPFQCSPVFQRNSSKWVLQLSKEPTFDKYKISLIRMESLMDPAQEMKRTVEILLWTQSSNQSSNQSSQDKDTQSEVLLYQWARNLSFYRVKSIRYSIIVDEKQIVNDTKTTTLILEMIFRKIAPDPSSHSTLPPSMAMSLLNSTSSATAATAAKTNASSSDQLFVGLYNQGATCYMNSVLQLLFRVIPFRQALFNQAFCPKTQPTCFYLQRMFWRMQELEQQPNQEQARICGTQELTLYGFGWHGNGNKTSEQQDSHDFARALFERLEQEFLVPPSTKEGLDQCFQGLYSTAYTCVKVDYSSKHPDQVLHELQLRVQDVKTISYSITKELEPELLSGENQFNTGTSHFGKQDATRTMVLKKLPSVLLCALKRFSMSATTQRLERANDSVRIENVLRESDFVFPKPPPLPPTEAPPPPLYYLFGIVVHTGQVLQRGHYTSYIRPLSAGCDYSQARWYHFDDSKVHEVTWKTVLEQSEPNATIAIYLKRDVVEALTKSKGPGSYDYLTKTNSEEVSQRLKLKRERESLLPQPPFYVAPSLDMIQSYERLKQDQEMNVLQLKAQKSWYRFTFLTEADIATKLCSLEFNIEKSTTTEPQLGYMKQWSWSFDIWHQENSQVNLVDLMQTQILLHLPESKHLSFDVSEFVSLVEGSALRPLCQYWFHRGEITPRGKACLTRLRPGIYMFYLRDSSSPPKSTESVSEPSKPWWDFNNMPYVVQTMVPTPPKNVLVFVKWFYRARQKALFLGSVEFSAQQPLTGKDIVGRLLDRFSYMKRMNEPKEIKIQLFQETLWTTSNQTTFSQQDEPLVAQLTDNTYHRLTDGTILVIETHEDHEISQDREISQKMWHDQRDGFFANASIQGAFRLAWALNLNTCFQKQNAKKIKTLDESGLLKETPEFVKFTQAASCMFAAASARSDDPQEMQTGIYQLIFRFYYKPEHPIILPNFNFYESFPKWAQFERHRHNILFQFGVQEFVIPLDHLSTLRDVDHMVARILCLQNSSLIHYQVVSTSNDTFIQRPQLSIGGGRHSASYMQRTRSQVSIRANTPKSESFLRLLAETKLSSTFELKVECFIEVSPPKLSFAVTVRDQNPHRDLQKVMIHDFDPQEEVKALKTKLDIVYNVSEGDEKTTKKQKSVLFVQRLHSTTPHQVRYQRLICLSENVADETYNLTLGALADGLKTESSSCKLHYQILPERKFPIPPILPDIKQTLMESLQTQPKAIPVMVRFGTLSLFTSSQFVLNLDVGPVMTQLFETDSWASFYEHLQSLCLGSHIEVGFWYPRPAPARAYGTAMSSRLLHPIREVSSFAPEYSNGSRSQSSSYIKLSALNWDEANMFSTFSISPGYDFATQQDRPFLVIVKK
jgi:ubiquitin C-terminal hydrolase